MTKIFFTQRKESVNHYPEPKTPANPKGIVWKIANLLAPLPEKFSWKREDTSLKCQNKLQKATPLISRRSEDIGKLFTIKILKLGA